MGCGAKPCGSASSDSISFLYLNRIVCRKKRFLSGMGDDIPPILSDTPTMAAGCGLFRSWFR